MIARVAGSIVEPHSVAGTSLIQRNWIIAWISGFARAVGDVETKGAVQ